MSCPALRLDGSAGLADALRAIDCRSGEAAGEAFARLFGAHGALTPALTILLTLFVALIGLGMLTGRVRVGAATLTPRMLTLGLALTFATSWAAYSQVVWTLATAAPDQLAGVIAGTHGSATDAFARALDRVFVAIAEAADAASRAPPVAGSAAPGSPIASPGLFTPTSLLWGSGLLLLLGTVGVLVTARIVLAALLAVGPVFVVLALFGATRGLFEGWLRAVALFALAPLFAVLIGGATLSAVGPVIAAAVSETGPQATRAMAALFLAAAIECALMLLALRTAAVIVSGWRPLGAAAGDRGGRPGASVSVAPLAPPAIGVPAAAGAERERVRALAATLAPVAAAANDLQPGPAPASARVRAAAAPLAASADRLAPVRRDGVGSRFRTAPSALPRTLLR